MSPAVSLQLFCLPYSGASATLFRRWQPSLPSWIRLLPLELPGRGLRFGEALHTDAASLVAQLAGELHGTLDSASPYAFFGHSLGGLLAFELAHAMRRRGLEGPLALFLSGVSPPAENDVSGYRRAKADAELVAALRDYRGTPEAVLNDPSLMQMLLPVVRADFLVTGSYRYQAHGPLDAALHLFGGREDSLRSAELLGWLHEAGGDFTLDLLDGQHFFIREQQGQLLRLLRRYAGQHLLRWHKDTVRGSMRAAS
ncbi:pyoverdine biosynthesis thioesterase PvdG [Pseudomonas aeruginosa]|uniref:pyoverdine biosynthesis thioesterase PvdG n=1 Tax=Pseudomonas aeruginosa TaxID=287 RepID=UPI000F78D38D|nr:pyoverdine biosynthesis thioesterase PvdG [Pseudomonas aeruginosa]RRY25134.1 thioesterase [Pseudomonas aeruginosa]